MAVGGHGERPEVRALHVAEGAEDDEMQQEEVEDQEDGYEGEEEGWGRVRD